MTTEKSKEVTEKAPEEKFTTPFHFATEDDETMGIETAVYPNGNTIKRLTLPDGQTAIVRELSALELSNIDNMITPKNQEDYVFYQLHFAVKVNGKQLAMEDWKNVKGKIFNRIKVPVFQLNF